MKSKILITLVVISALVSKSFGQLNSNGQKSLEVLISPLGSEPVKINGIKGRYFTSSNTAIRSSVFLGGNTTNSVTQEQSDGLLELKSKNTSRDFSFVPGYEIHMAAGKKISPYYGVEGLISVSSSKSIDESQWLQEEKIQETINKSRNSTLGINLLTGVDCYISEGLFLGFEFGFGLTKELRGINSIEYINPEDSSLESSKTKGNTSNLAWGPNYNGAFRFGWKF